MHSVSEYYNLSWKKYLITMFRCMLQCLSYSILLCVIVMFIVLGDVLYDSSSYRLCPTCHHLFSGCQLCDMSNWLDVSLFVSNLVRAPTVACVLAVWLIGNLLLAD